MAAATAALALTVLAWPFPGPSRRLRELWAVGQADGERERRRIPPWLWAAMLPLPLMAGPFVALAAVIAGRTAVSMFRDSRGRAAADAGTAEMARVAEVLVAELRAGAAPVAALSAASREAGPALGGACAAAAARARLGGSASAALRSVADGAGDASDELRRIVAAWRVADVHGLPLADIIDHGRGDVVARRAHRSRTAAALAGPRMTMLILAALPAFGAALGQALGANPVGFLTGGGVGGAVLVVGVGLACAGVLWGSRILASAEGRR